MSGSPQELARACSRWSRYGCPASGLMSEGQGNFRAVYARVATSRLSDGAVRETLMHPMQPGPGDCLQRVFWFGTTPICGGVHSCSVAGGEPARRQCDGWEGGYSAVRVLRYTPCSFTPAMPPGPVFSNCCSRTPTTWRRLCCACRRLPTPGHTGDHVACGSWPLPADGGCSQMPTPPLETTALNRAPSMYCGVLGPART